MFAPAASNGTEKPTCFRLMLFLADNEPNSKLARDNLARFCQDELGDRYEVKIVDVLEDYEAAMEHHVLITPCLVILAPAPRVAIAGTLQDTARVRAAFGLKTE
jgi:circadian clock protein KaiB